MGGDHTNIISFITGYDSTSLGRLLYGFSVSSSRLLTIQISRDQKYPAADSTQRSVETLITMTHLL